MHGMGPQAVDLQVGIEALETCLFFAGLANAQAPERHLEAERVEFQALQVRRDGGVVRQLLVGDAQGNAGQNQKAEQAVQGEDGQQGADGAFQSFGHVMRRLAGN
ncbi:hypothetical protein D9M71_99930 [compost metagenome]